MCARVGLCTHTLHLLCISFPLKLQRMPESQRSYLGLFPSSEPSSSLLTSLSLSLPISYAHLHYVLLRRLSCIHKAPVERSAHSSLCTPRGTETLSTASVALGQSASELKGPPWPWSLEYVHCPPVPHGFAEALTGVCTLSPSLRTVKGWFCSDHISDVSLSPARESPAVRLKSYPDIGGCRHPSFPAEGPTSWPNGAFNRNRNWQTAQILNTQVASLSKLHPHLHCRQFQMLKWLLRVPKGT